MAAGSGGDLIRLCLSSPTIESCPALLTKALKEFVAGVRPVSEVEVLEVLERIVGEHAGSNFVGVPCWLDALDYTKHTLEGVRARGGALCSAALQRGLTPPPPHPPS